MNQYRKKVRNACEKFNNEFLTMFEDMMNKNEISKINIKKNVKKISFVPIKLNDNNQPCVILGKHVNGKRKNQFNFLGGLTRSDNWKEWIAKSYEDRMYIISNTLFNEVYEEFGIILDCENLRKCLIDVKRADTFLLFYVSIHNIDFNTWKENQENINSYSEISQKFKEISEIQEFSLDFIENEYERLRDPTSEKFDFYVEGEELIVSRYVISMIRQLKKNCEKLNDCKGIKLENFEVIPIQDVFGVRDVLNNSITEN